MNLSLRDTPQYSFLSPIFSPKILKYVYSDKILHIYICIYIERETNRQTDRMRDRQTERKKDIYREFLLHVNEQWFRDESPAGCRWTQRKRKMNRINGKNYRKKARKQKRKISYFMKASIGSGVRVQLVPHEYSQVLCCAHYSTREIRNVPK